MEAEDNDIVIHSFINAHTHLPLTPFRGLLEDLYFHDWLPRLIEMEGVLTERDMRHLYEAGVYENLAEGNTVIYSMYNYYWTIRDTLGTELHIGPKSFREEEDVETLLRKFIPPENAVATVYMHSLYKYPLEEVVEASLLAKERGMEFQMHVGETKEEVKWIKERYGDYPVRLLSRENALHEGVMLVHCGWITKSELLHIAEAGAKMVHVPVPNMKLAIHGFFPWREAYELGIDVYIGTDSAVSNNGQSILHDLRVALLSLKDRYWDGGLNGIEMATIFDEKGWIVLSPKPYMKVNTRNLVHNLFYTPHAFTIRSVWREGEKLYPSPPPEGFRVVEEIMEERLWR